MNFQSYISLISRVQSDLKFDTFVPCLHINNFKKFNKIMCLKWSRVICITPANNLFYLLAFIGLWQHEFPKGQTSMAVIAFHCADIKPNIDKILNITISYRNKTGSKCISESNKLTRHSHKKLCVRTKGRKEGRKELSTGSRSSLFNPGSNNCLRFTRHRSQNQVWKTTIFHPLIYYRPPLQ